MSYDPELRRDTPLAQEIKKWIKARGSIGLEDFVSVCLWHEEHGYYTTKSVLGQSGDFVTAPEISQVFGELLGLWAAITWQQMGSPANVNLVELGPGRGTLMADALRATSRVPGFHAALHITMVEASPGLRAKQQATLAGAHQHLSWTDVFRTSTQAPTILLANEFLDVYAPYQCIKTPKGWCRRAVELDAAGLFQLTVAADASLRPDLDQLWPEAPVGSILSHIRSDRLADKLADVANGLPLVALFIDYGHSAPALGDTLQAVREHRFEHPLTSPGEADLSVQVNFADVAADMKKLGFMVDGPTTQGEFLGRLGIMERASKLMSANPKRAGEIETGVARLMAVPGMGDRFKVMGVRTQAVPVLPGF